MRDIGRSDDKGNRRTTGNTCPQIMPGKTKLADMGGQPLAFFQRVLDRMRCGKCLRTEQQESQQEMKET